MGIVKVNTSSWDEVVISSHVPVVVDFSMTGCSPCEKMRPDLVSISEDREDLLFVEVVINDAVDLAHKYEVRAAPTIKVFVSGKDVATNVGLLSKTDIVEFIEASVPGV